MRIIAFYSYKIIEPKVNYNIYNKKLFIIVEALYK